MNYPPEMKRNVWQPSGYKPPFDLYSLMSNNTIIRLIEETSAKLSQISDTPILDAQVIIAHILNKSRSWVISHSEINLSANQIDLLKEALKKMENGIPLPYILGYWEFYGRKFLITPDVLIPRPDTELLVEKALFWANNLYKTSSNSKILCADVGCGSGCIGISLAAENPRFNVIASDISYPALRVALKNASLHLVDSQIHLIQCDLLPSTSLNFDLICANLPYIPSNTLRHLKVYKKEPTLALDGGVNGLEIIERLLYISPHRLTKNGLILLEIDPDQGWALQNLARNIFPDASIDLIKDLAGHHRLISIQKGK